MSGIKYLLDTNIILYLLSSGDQVNRLLSKIIFVSFITELELYSFSFLEEKDKESIALFLNKVTIVDINPAIKNRTIYLRKKYHLKLPDAIICATAWHLKCTFVSNDQKLFKINEIETLGLKSFLTE